MRGAFHDDDKAPGWFATNSLVSKTVDGFNVPKVADQVEGLWVEASLLPSG
jgi:hypothetical protein